MKHATIAIIISLLLLSNQAQAFDNPTDVVYINGHPVARTDVDIDTNIAPHYHPAMGGSVTPLDGSSPILDDGMSFPGLGLVSGLGLGSFLSSSGFSNSDQLAILALFSIGLTPADIFFNPTFQPLVRLLKILAFLNQFSLYLTMGILAGPDFVPQPAQSAPPPTSTPEPSKQNTTPGPSSGSTPDPNDSVDSVIPELEASIMLPGTSDPTALRQQAKDLRDKTGAHRTRMEQIISAFGPGTEWLGHMVPLPNGDPIHDLLVDEYMKHFKAENQLIDQANKLDKQADTLMAQAGQTGDTPQTDSPGPASPDTTPTSSTDNRVKALQKKISDLQTEADAAMDAANDFYGKAKEYESILDGTLKKLGAKSGDDLKHNGNFDHDLLVDAYGAALFDYQSLNAQGDDLRAEANRNSLGALFLKEQGVTEPLPGNGSIQTFPDGREITILPHGAGKIERGPDGTTTITGPGGAWRTTTLANGRSRTYLSNGTTITTFLASDPEAKGSTKVKVVKPDGSGWIQDADGKILVEF